MIKNRPPNSPSSYSPNLSGSINNTPFKLKQCIYSTIALKNKIDNIPGTDFVNPTLHEFSKDNIVINLHRLFKHCINRILDRFGSNLVLTSVYRNKELNKLLGGVETSQHTYGYAADMAFKDGTPSSYLFNWCKLYIPQYHQLIWEYPEKGDFDPIFTNDPSTVLPSDYIGYEREERKFSWVHISYIEGNNNKINSVSSTNPKIHTAYKDENTFYLDNFTHRIEVANEKLNE